MAQHNSPSQAEPSWLLPSNRKLRNVVAISLRNISIAASSPARKRGQTFDDDALPQTLKSPAKLLALKEQKALGHSRSSTDLRAVAEDDAVVDGDSTSAVDSVNGSPIGSKQKARDDHGSGGTPPRRPHFRKLRRRSTLEWANATPHRRQQRLEDVIRDRTADVFFSLHVEGLEAPVYVSETVEQTMNPTFRHIDWSTCGPGITRQDSITIRVWVNGGKSTDWRQLLHMDITLGGLHYLGKSLDKLDRALPENAIVIQLADGVYTAPSETLTALPPSRPATSATRKAPTLRPLPTSSFDALLRLAKLDDSIQDALATRDQIAHDLEALLLANREALIQRDEVAEVGDRIKTIDYAKTTVEKQLEKARKQQQEKRASLSARRKLMKSDTELRGHTAQTIQETRPSFESLRAEHDVKKGAMQNQRRRICEDLQRIYPIEQLPGKVLSFSIGGLHLPNAEQLDSEPPEVVAAALGHVAHTLQLLSFYLAYPLPYPVTPRGSTSSIYDSISILQTKNAIPNEKAEDKLRTYPLFSKSMPRFRLEYAVFLLNQNIRILLESAFGLRVLDIRQTLPNLKYLLYVATAGDGELPARKAGGIRGLMRAPAMQRVGSADSASSGLSGLTLFSNGKSKMHSGAADRLREISAKVASPGETGFAGG